MTAVAVVVLALWALGIVALAAAVPKLVASEPMARLVFDLRPELTALVLAVLVVLWPGALGAALLIRAVEHGRRR